MLERSKYVLHGVKNETCAGITSSIWESPGQCNVLSLSFLRFSEDAEWLYKAYYGRLTVFRGPSLACNQEPVFSGHTWSTDT
eukprot:4974207-Pleurochrysis_carterae.AAC.1